MKKIELQEDQALVIQVVNQAGEDNVEELIETLSFDRSSLLNILQNLQHKGLIVFNRTSYDLYVRLSSKGKKTVNLLWPEVPYIRYS